MPPCSASHLNTGSTGSRARSMPTPRCFGSTRGMLSVKPPPVMWARPLTAPVSRIARRQRLHIEPRRRQQRAAERHDRRERRRRIEAKPGLLDDLAHQRKAVGVHARRGEADHRVAGLDIAPRQQRAALGRADRKAAEIVIAVLVQAGHFRGLAADQRAAGFAAAFGDAGDDRGRRLRDRACRRRNSRGRTAARRPARRGR